MKVPDLEEVGKGSLGRLNVQSEDAADKLAQWHFAELLLKLLPRPCHIIGKQNLLQCLPIQQV